MLIGFLFFIAPSLFFLEEKLIQTILIVFGLVSILSCTFLGLYLFNKGLELKERG